MSLQTTGMTEKERAKAAALEKSMWADLRKTVHGFREGDGGGVHWQNAQRKHKAITALLAKDTPSIVYPIANPDFNVIEGGLHETAGVNGNWSIDFICKAGLGIVAVETATITRFSGHHPSDDSADQQGVYGWSTWYRTEAGYLYFATHQGRRYPTLRVGMRVQAGDLLGYVGDQRFRPDHLHLGVTSPKGEADAKARIQQVARAPRVS